MQEHLLTEPIGITLPPTQDELPCDDGEPMETARHRQQMFLLLETLQPWLDQRPDGYAGGNMFLYFSLAQIRHRLVPHLAAEGVMSQVLRLLRQPIGT